MGHRQNMDGNTLRILVCGGRDYDNVDKVYEVLDEFPTEELLIIHGGARGADSLAGVWAFERGVQVTRYPADWEKYGKRAGYVRNQQMLDEGKPDLVIAFPGGRGTAMMIDIAEKAAVNVLKIS
jgi:hypothetical protein